jgi:hypothetical protein
MPDAVLTVPSSSDPAKLQSVPDAQSPLSRFSGACRTSMNVEPHTIESHCVLWYLAGSRIPWCGVASVTTSSTFSLPFGKPAQPFADPSSATRATRPPMEWATISIDSPCRVWLSYTYFANAAAMCLMRVPVPDQETWASQFVSPA